MSYSQTIRPEQTLTERWEATYTRFPWSYPGRFHTTARIHMPHPTVVGSSGMGTTVEEARLDGLVMLAAGYISVEPLDEDKDENPIHGIRDETLDFLAKTVRAEQRRRRLLRKAATS